MRIRARSVAMIVPRVLDRVEEEGEEQMAKQRDELQRDRELQLELLEEDEYEEWRTSLVDRDGNGVCCSCWT